MTIARLLCFARNDLLLKIGISRYQSRVILSARLVDRALWRVNISQGVLCRVVQCTWITSLVAGVGGMHMGKDKCYNHMRATNAMPSRNRHWLVFLDVPRGCCI